MPAPAAHPTHPFRVTLSESPYPSYPFHSIRVNRIRVTLSSRTIRVIALGEPPGSRRGRAGCVCVGKRGGGARRGAPDRRAAIDPHLSLPAETGIDPSQAFLQLLEFRISNTPPGCAGPAGGDRPVLLAASDSQLSSTRIILRLGSVSDSDRFPTRKARRDPRRRTAPEGPLRYLFHFPFLFLVLYCRLNTTTSLHL